MHFRTPILVTISLNFYLPNNNGTLSLDSPILLRLMHSDLSEVLVLICSMNVYHCAGLLLDLVLFFNNGGHIVVVS
jgi:hypothetical protein